MTKTSNRISKYLNDPSACEPGTSDFEWHSDVLFPPSQVDLQVVGDPSEDVVASFLRGMEAIQTGHFQNAVAGFLEALELRSASDPNSTPTSIVVPISSLAPEPFHLISQINAVVQGVDGDYTAKFFDANIGASGETQQEAVDNLKELLVLFYESLAEEKDENLGPPMKKQKAVLEAFIKRA